MHSAYSMIVENFFDHKELRIFKCFEVKLKLQTSNFFWGVWKSKQSLIKIKCKAHEFNEALHAYKSSAHFM